MNKNRIRWLFVFEVFTWLLLGGLVVLAGQASAITFQFLDVLPWPTRLAKSFVAGVTRLYELWILVLFWGTMLYIVRSLKGVRNRWLSKHLKPAKAGYIKYPFRKSIGENGEPCAWIELLDGENQDCGHLILRVAAKRNDQSDQDTSSAAAFELSVYPIGSKRRKHSILLAKAAVFGNWRAYQWGKVTDTHSVVVDDGARQELIVGTLTVTVRIMHKTDARYPDLIQELILAVTSVVSPDFSQA